MPNSKDNRRAGPAALRAFQLLLFVLLLVIWHVLTSPSCFRRLLLRANQAAFFFGEP